MVFDVTANRYEERNRFGQAEIVTGKMLVPNLHLNQLPLHQIKSATPSVDWETPKSQLAAVGLVGEEVHGNYEVVADDLVHPPPLVSTSACAGHPWNK